MKDLVISDPLAVPSALVNCHGPFCWGLDAEEAVYNAVALEEIARMAFYTVLLNHDKPIDQNLLDKHFHAQAREECILRPGEKEVKLKFRI